MHPLLRAALVLFFALAATAQAGAQSQPAARLASPRATAAEARPTTRASTTRASATHAPAHRPSRHHRQQRLRLSIALAGALGAGLSLAIADVAAQRRGSSCAESQPAELCVRARRATGLGSFTATSLLLTPFAMWIAGHVQGGRGGYGVPLLMTVAGLMLAGLTVAVTQSVASASWGRHLGYGVAVVLPATFGAFGYLARDAERRRFGGVSLTPRRGGAELGYVRRF